MKKKIFILGIFTLSLTLFAQELAQESLVINVEVPVRVFKSSTFVSDLTIDDFEVYEDGKLQRLEAVYLIKKTGIERKEEKKRFTPDTSRNFYLIFQITEYSPRINDALNYFIQNVLMPGDNLFVVTPMRTYEMNYKALKLRSTEEIVNELKGLLRKDAMLGSSEYRSTLGDLTKLTRALASTVAGGDETDMAKKQSAFATSEYEDMEPSVKLEMLLTLYTSALERLDLMRYVDQNKLLEFAEHLKNKEGQKYVFLFYQREFIPQIEPRILSQTLGLLQDQQHVIQNISDVFNLHKREISVDVNQVKRAYSDSSASIHFMFFTKPAEYIPGIRFEEHSEDIFSAFNEMARATGGSTESSSNPNFLFKKAVESSENYYLLYYAPIEYKKDGKFKQIEVKIKNKNYRISHRAGYFAK
ncbi:MAG: hypothetical protein WBC02_03990 [Candidatus Aminicenantaceae bacterium]